MATGVPGAPNLDVRLTRSHSGSILDIDFVGVMGMDHAAVAQAGMAASHHSSSSAPPTNALVQMPAMNHAVMAAGRRLKIIEHRVHKVEMRTKDNGEQEEELIVSNLRPFTLKVGVHDQNESPILDCSLPLRASLLYENGLPVRQTSNSEPLLVGETDVVALQGAATFKLRITSLSSHRDKQRFRIQVAPQEVEVQLGEPNLCVVTDPMKSVTKLGRSSASSTIPTPMPAPGGDVPANGEPSDGLKRKYGELLAEHSSQLSALEQSQAHIMSELKALSQLLQQRLCPPPLAEAASRSPSANGPKAEKGPPETTVNGSASA